MNINIHIDITMNIDIHIIINMSIEDCKRHYLLIIKYSLLAVPYWEFPIGYSRCPVWAYSVSLSCRFYCVTARDDGEPTRVVRFRILPRINSYSAQEGAPQGNRQGNILPL